MKKVLIVAYYFPPIVASGSLRPLAFCHHLETYGWLPRVLTTTPDSVYPALATDEHLCQQLPQNLRIDRVTYTNPFHALISARDEFYTQLRRSFHYHSKRPLTLGEKAEQKRSEHRSLFATFKDYISERFSFPDPQSFWLRPAVRRLSQLPMKDRPDVVFATGSPWTGLLVGKTLAQKFGVPFVADFRDPWTGNNPYKRPLSPQLFRKARKLETSVCAAAARVVTNTVELQAQFETDYPHFKGKFVTISNGFDSESNSSVNPVDDDRNSGRFATFEKSALEMHHFGTVYGLRNPVVLLQALKELRDENKIGSGQLRIRFTGTWSIEDKRCETLALRLEQEGVIRREPPTPHQLCTQQMALAQVLLVLQPASPLQIPAKMYEYIAAGRPILVIGGEGATAHLVEQHRLGRCCPNQVAAIKKLLWCLATGRTQLNSPPPRERTRFHYRMLTGELARILDTVSTNQMESSPIC